MKRLIACLLTTLLLLSQMVVVSYAEDIRKSGLFSYTLKGNGTAIIVGFDDEANGNRDVYVPAQIDGYTVSEIGTEAFKYAKCKCVVMLPETITTIGKEAFYASSFTSIQIPASVKVIGIDALAHMTNIKKMSVDSENAVYATIDGILYNKQTKALIAAPFNDTWDTVSITIPSGIKEIGEGAFSDYKHLDICMPSTLTTISANAFAWADIEGKFVIPNTVESIGENAFYHTCFYMERNNIRGLYLPASIKKLGDSAFEKCFGFGFANSYENYHYIDLSATQLVDIPSGAFSNVKSIAVDYVALPKNLKTIGDFAFCSVNVGRKNGLTLPLSVESIGTSAFAGGSGKFSIPVDSQLRTIGDRAFANFKFSDVDTTLALPNTLERIGNEAFADVKGIECIAIPASVTYIGENFCNRAEITLDVQPGSYAEFWASENGYSTTLDSSEEDTSWLFE